MATNRVEPVFKTTRLIHVPRELVWRAWTDPAQLAQWWGPNYFSNPICEIDARAGGNYRIVMRGPDGVDYPVSGVFLEVVKPERLVMTMDVSEHPDEWHDQLNPDRSVANPAGEMLMTVMFEADEDRTQLTIQITFENTQIRDAMLKLGMEQGWSESLDRMTSLLMD
ncbi:MAG: SRPBCC domain-containing protein [Candidatus Sumerlaeia bacterium]